MTSQETIAAQATAPGRAGIAVVRVSGPQVKTIISSLLNCELPARQAVFSHFYTATGEVIDEGIALFFPQPHSFTGEDVLELQGHGSPIVIDLLLKRLLELGARLARPGEFSERAFLNGKMDLTQAEAIADLIDASSSQAARLALRSLQGEFSKNIHALTEKLIHLRMYVEAAIDFVEEEINFLADKKIKNELEENIVRLDTLINSGQQGSFLREGIQVVIMGKPNVGKSSLLNCLSGKEIAIVTDIPGTTRDVLRQEILIDGMPIHIIDTAGLRESEDIVEQEGIKRAYAEMRQADLILYLHDAQEVKSEDLLNASLPMEEGKNIPVIFIRNKIDLCQETAAIQQCDKTFVVSLSAKKSLGINELKEAIQNSVGFQGGSNEGLFLARRRHLDALARAKMHLLHGLHQLKQHEAGELLAEDLRAAQQALGEITGEFTADDLLGRIFSQFCIGK